MYQPVDKHGYAAGYAAAQERKAFGKGERRYGIYEAMSEVETIYQRHKRRYRETSNPYDFAALAVLEDVIMRLADMERVATEEYDYAVWVWVQDCSGTPTQAIPTGGAK